MMHRVRAGLRCTARCSTATCRPRRSCWPPAPRWRAQATTRHGLPRRLARAFWPHPCSRQEQQQGRSCPAPRMHGRAGMAEAWARSRSGRASSSVPAVRQRRGSRRVAPPAEQLQAWTSPSEAEACCSGAHAAGPADRAAAAGGGGRAQRCARCAGGLQLGPRRQLPARHGRRGCPGAARQVRCGVRAVSRALSSAWCGVPCVVWWPSGPQSQAGSAVVQAGAAVCSGLAAWPVGPLCAGSGATRGRACQQAHGATQAQLPARARRGRCA